MLRTVLVLCLLPALLLLPGCPLGCGYDGDGDRMLRRGDDTIMLCANGGHVANLATGVVEGKRDDLGQTVHAFTETGALAYEITLGDDGLWSSQQLGSGWELIELNEVDLDHAHIQCSDLETRSWWTP